MPRILRQSLKNLILGLRLLLKIVERMGKYLEAFGHFLLIFFDFFKIIWVI